MGGGDFRNSIPKRKRNLEFVFAFLILFFFTAAANANFEKLEILKNETKESVAIFFDDCVDGVSAQAAKVSGGLAAAAEDLKIGSAKIRKIASDTARLENLIAFKKSSGLNLAGDAEKQKQIAENETIGKVAGDETPMINDQFVENPNLSFWQTDSKIEAQDILDALNHDLTYEQIAEHSIRRWNLNSNAVNSRKIVDYSIQSRDLANNAVNSRTIQNNSIRSEDLAKNIAITGSFNTLGPLTIGSHTTSHDLGTEGDLLVSNRLEVDGPAYLDSTLYVKDSSSLSTLTSTTLATKTANISNILSNSNLVIRGRLPDEDTFSIYEFTQATINPSGLTQIGESTPVELDTDAKKAHSLLIENNLEVQGTIYGTFAGAFTPSGNVDMGNHLFTNIGAAGTDFTATGGLTLADQLTLIGLSGVLKATAGAVSGSATTTDLPEGTNLYYLDSRARGALSSTATGLTYTNGTGIFSLTAGYVIPTTTQESNWGTAYTNRVDTWNAPVTFAGNAVSFSYNATNLQLTANALNTIQDIAVLSSPTFAGMTLNGNLALGANTLITSNATVISNLNADLLDGNHANAFQTALTNPVTGTGTTGYLTRWATSSTVGNSVIYDDGTNVGIGTSTPGTAKLSVMNGNVGIGTTSPGAALQIGTDNSFAPGLLIGGGTATTNYLSFSGGRGMIGHDQTGFGNPLVPSLALGSGGGRGIEFFVNGTNGTFLSGTRAMVIDSTGNVGIGTTSPGYKLDVVGDIGFTGNIINYAGADNALFQIRGTNVARYLQIQTSSLGAYLIGVGNGGTGSHLYLGTSGGYQQVTIDSTGNVGIGTTSPGYKLEVFDTSGGGHPIVARSNAVGWTEINAMSGVGDTVQAQLFAGAADANPIKIGARTNTQVAFTVADSPKMVIATSGNVGIGTTSPGNKLSVSGGVGIGTTAPGSLFRSTKAPDGGMIVESNVGIGTTAPGQALDVVGDMRTNGCVYYNGGTLGACASDQRLKKNIDPLAFSGALEKVMGLQPKTFSYKNDPARIYSGLVAQDVQQVAPELVTTGKDGYLQVKYGDVQWMTIEAIQEQQTQISQSLALGEANSRTLGDVNLQITENNSDVSGLQTAVNDKLTLVGSKFDDIQKKMGKIEETPAGQKEELAALSENIAELVKTDSMMISRLDDHEIRIAALEAERLVGGSAVSAPLDLSPALKKFDGALASTLDADGKPVFSLAGEFHTKVLGAENLKLGGDISGKGKIKAGETEIIIETTLVSKNSKIYLTCQGDYFESYPFYDEVKEGKSFKVKIKKLTAEGDINFDWLIVN